MTVALYTKWQSHSTIDTCHHWWHKISRSFHRIHSHRAINRPKWPRGISTIALWTGGYRAFPSQSKLRSFRYSMNDKLCFRIFVKLLIAKLWVSTKKKICEFMGKLNLGNFFFFFFTLLALGTSSCRAFILSAILSLRNCNQKRQNKLQLL